MRQHVLEHRDLAAFRRSLQVRERSQATVEKYLREAEAFLQTLRPGQAVTKELVLAWKAALARRYASAPSTGSWPPSTASSPSWGGGTARWPPCAASGRCSGTSGRS